MLLFNTGQEGVEEGPDVSAIGPYAKTTNEKFTLSELRIFILFYFIFFYISIEVINDCPKRSFLVAI